MANKKLTDLTELTTPADNDFLYIVDVSDTTESAQGTSKKIRKDKVDSGASKENIANKQNNLTPDGTGTKYPTVDAVNAVLPTSYSKIVYVNTTSPTTATVFDLNNPPVTNDNALKNDTANLYIGTDAGTWVYLTGSGYVTKTVPSTSNFNTFGTTVDAGNSKTSHITRSGPVTLTGSLNLAVAKISTTPNTSAGSYDILTRNSSTTALEKKLVSDFVTSTGITPDISGKVGFNRTDLNSSELRLYNNSASTIVVENNYASGSFRQANNLSNGYSNVNINSSTGIFEWNRNTSTGINFLNENNSTGIFFDNKNNSTGVFNSFNNFSTGILNRTNSVTGSTGDLQQYLKNNIVTTSINHLGEIITMTPTASGQVSTKGYVDAKITQTITNGVTDKSPSEDAVYDALANVTRNIIAKSGPNTTLTGTLTTTILKSVLIPSNTFSDYDVLNIPSLKFEKTGTNANAIFKIYINTVDSISGATLIGTYTASNTSTLIKMTRSYSLRNGFLIGVIFSASVSSDIGASVSPVSSTAFDVTTNNYLIITGQLGNINDSILLSEIIIQK